MEQNDEGTVIQALVPEVEMQTYSQDLRSVTSGEGVYSMTFARYERNVKKGDFIYLPPWCVHGIENTGRETLVVLICTSPPNP